MAPAPSHILVVDDDPRIRTMITRYFEGEGYRVSAAQNGTAMRNCLARDDVDVILMDLVLPGEDGIELAREIRAQSNVGIIMLTGRSDVVDRIVGLEVGADDYVAKPFHLRELHARVKTLQRRVRPPSPEGAATGLPERVICFDGFRFSVERRELRSPDGSDITLTTAEFELLLIMVQRAGRVLDRDTLMDLTRGRERDAFDRTIDAQVARLRKKIEMDRDRPALIKSVRGVGYVFTGRVEQH